MSKKIFIIVPVYNSALYLPECLASIKAQSYKDFYCIMVNDGSTDGSKEICGSYTSDERFILLSQENKGVAAARNTGLNYVLEHASDGDYLTFVDSDDFISDAYLKKFADTLDSIPNPTKETIFFCGWMQFMTDGKTMTHKQESKESVVFGNFREDFVNLDSFLQTLWSNFYSIALIKEKNIIFDEKLKRSEDINFNFCYSYFVEQYAFINECLYNYRELPTSLSRTETQTAERMDMRIKNIEQRLKFLTDCKIPNSQQVLNKHISNMVTGSLFSPYHKRLYELKKYSDWRLSQGGQRRILFCLQHNLLWVYKVYLQVKKTATSLPPPVKQ
ncbi:MAG: glycosyltransferase [Treponema sp.]|uniref:glycosyltransferase family 2 protein n=1 Tax=Treponema sp. TaxID=166 RepID=UPI0025CCCA01|nr:glycosyltransferase family 2 protein [Treponema sp.]MBQ9283351.1 glycosyltransferase [Treponema sp.]